MKITYQKLKNRCRFCQLSAIGAKLPSTKSISCEFLLSQFDKLNAATKDLAPIQLTNKLQDEKSKILISNILELADDKDRKDLPPPIQLNNNKLKDEKSKVLRPNNVEDAGEKYFLPKTLGLKKPSLTLF